MPHVNIWIRKDDYEQWKMIDDKPAFIRGALRTFQNPTTARASISLLEAVAEKKLPKRVLGVLDTMPQVQSITFCKHGFNPKLCKFAKMDKTRRQKWCK